MRVFRVKTLFLLFVLGLTVLHGVSSQDPGAPVYRLPSTITPQLYELRLVPDLDTGIITGSVSIQINTTSNETEILNDITLHMGTNVTVNETSAIIIDTDGTVKLLGAIEYDDDNTLLKMSLPEGQSLNYSHIYVIRLYFKSYLNTEPKGLFVGNYNSTSKYVASNFRPTHARDVFPCFDEPQYKVPVALQVVRPASYYAVSTAPLQDSSDLGDNMTLDTFSNTEPISIHSLGLFIGEQPSVSSMGLNVVVPPDMPTSVDYLQTLVSGLIKEYGPFPLAPLTLVVLPDTIHTSFSTYGFVFTSPEVYLAKVGSLMQWTNLQLQLTEQFLRQYLEYAKTPYWWSDIWLSESIGSYLSLQQSQPWEDYVKIVIRSQALGSYTSPPGPVITGQDLSKWDIENIISDGTVKFKGLSTLLMWSQTMPDGVVAKTIADFLKLRKSVVSTMDLLSIMVDNIKANTTYDVTPVILSLPNWLAESGSPLVWFSIDPNGTSFTLDQATPCPAGSPVPASRPISVNLAAGSTPDWTNTQQARWLLNTSTQYPYTVEANQPSVINIETGTYRVNYPDSHWATLIEALPTGWAPTSVFNTLQDDAVALSLNGCLDFPTALSVLNSTQNSTLGWYTMVKATDSFIAMIGLDWYGFTAFRSYFASLFSADLLDQLDVRKSDSYPELNVTRELVTPWLCQFNIGTCREAVMELGNGLMLGNISGIADSDLDNVACYGARYTPGALEPLLDAYQNATSAWLRRSYTIALSCLIEQSSVKDLLDIIMNSTSTQVSVKSNDTQVTVNPSDARQMVVGLASSLENSQIILNFIISQSTDIETKLGVKTLSAVITNLAKHRVDLSQLSSLQDAKLNPHVIQTAAEAQESSQRSQTWYSSFSSKLYQALPQGQSSTTTTEVTTVTAPQPGPTSSSTSAPAPAGASGIPDNRILTVILAALLIVLEITLR